MFDDDEDEYDYALDDEFDFEPYEETLSDAFRIAVWSVLITLVVIGGLVAVAL